MSLTVENLTKVYAEQKALDSVSFSVSGPQVVGLLGPNGAGKSTLMKIVCCYLAPSSGRVEVCGMDTARHSLSVRSRIGYLPEHNPLYLDMYVKEYLDFVGGIYLEAKTVVSRRDEVISLVGLGSESHKKIGALSKGYRQRLGLAQALIHDPEVLILDEPTSGLDPNQLEEIRGLIREIGTRRIVVFSTHIMQEAQAVCGRILLLHHGRLVADAPTGELMGCIQGESRVIVEFDRAVSVDDLSRLEGVIEVNSLSLCRYGIRSHSATDIRPALFSFAVSRGISILTLQKEYSSLETVFHRLTRTGKED